MGVEAGECVVSYAAWRLSRACWWIDETLGGGGDR